MDTEREQRMEALRARVKAKKEAALAGEVEDELVVSTAELEPATTEAEDEWYAMIDRDADRWRNLAAALIFIGSLLGMMSGALILQGNPSELLNPLGCSSPGMVLA